MSFLPSEAAAFTPSSKCWHKTILLHWGFSASLITGMYVKVYPRIEVLCFYVSWAYLGFQKDLPLNVPPKVNCAMESNQEYNLDQVICFIFGSNIHETV